MRIIISPAKKMAVNTDVFSCGDLPRFLPQTEMILTRLNELSGTELKALWKCNDQIAALNIERLRTMDLRHGLTPAILAYEGIQYQYMAPDVFTQAQLDYIEEHLRILSGFYGILAPFDGVTPYRLEMQAKLSMHGCKDLYAFWNTQIAQSLFGESDCIINLASKEYSTCVSRYQPPNTCLITCVFGERKGEKLIEKGTMCKMARGEMVRFMAENNVKEPEHLIDFDSLNYRFSPEDSDLNTYTFIRGET